MTDSASRTYFVRHLWRALTGQRETLDFAKEAPIASTYQGRVVVDLARCRRCGACQRICPANAIEVTRPEDGGARVRVYHDRCAMCGLCELVCPTDAVWREARFVAASDDPATLVETWQSGDEQDS